MNQPQAHSATDSATDSATVTRPADMPRGIAGLLWLMQRLRAEDGCKWDRAQDHTTLRPYVLEEAHEVVEAIVSGDPDKLREELGDLMFQVVFHTQLTSERDAFDFNDVVEAVTEKMLRRHPHVFGDRTVHSPEEALDTWNEMKRREKATAWLEGQSALTGVPRTLPACLLAQRLGEKAAGIGFDWKSARDVLPIIDGEMRELLDALDEPDKARRKARLHDELGDVLFSVVNLARKLGVDSETALRDAALKFADRFEVTERIARDRNITLTPDDVPTLDALWAEAKQQLAK